MSIPNEVVAIPARVSALADGAALECVWRNELGGLTFKASPAQGLPFFIKWGPRNAEFNVADEADRLAWASGWIQVPRVLDFGSDENHEWLVTAGIDGESAVAPRWVADPAVAVRAVGEGLRAMHDRLPVDECPWEWSVGSRLEDATRRGLQLPQRLRDEAPSPDKLVVCHGDACCPNTLVDGNGRWLAHVDLGHLGTGDRWADIAVATMSTEWNYGPGWEDALLDAYGIDPDAERLRYYRDLWNAT